MKLEDLKTLFGEAIEKADFVVHSIGRSEQVCSVALRLDSDGVTTLIFHVGHTVGRTETSESTHLKNAMELYDYFGQTTAGEMDGAYIDWETLNDALDGYGWPDDEYSPDEIPDRISTLLKDRNSLAEEIETLKKKLQPPKLKEEPKKNTETMKGEDKPHAFKPGEIDALRGLVFDALSKKQPMKADRITKSCGIPISATSLVLNHEWFEETKSGWRIAIKEKGL